MRVAFVYSGGRESRLEAARRGTVPKDFFYGAIEFERAGHKVSVHDLGAAEPGWMASGLNKMLKGRFPPKTRAQEIIAAFHLLKKLEGADVVVATASGCAFALGFWKKLGRFDAELLGIHCGIVNCFHAPAPRRSAAWIMTAMKTVLFADNEAEEMARQFGVDSPHSAWFGVDENFWSPPDEGSPRSGVLAVGNDSRRDYKTLLDAAALLPDVPFKIVTRLSLGSAVPANVRHIHGDWNTDAVSDETLREFYRASACVAVPLHESIQPSGQSVAMQAMMCGAPVVMTKTSGWWGADVLRSGEHLFEVQAQDPEALVQVLRQAKEAGGGIARRAREALVGVGWTTRGFSERLQSVIASECGRTGGCAD